MKTVIARMTMCARAPRPVWGCCVNRVLHPPVMTALSAPLTAAIRQRAASMSITAAACNDGSACTADDICSGGVCQGQPITCDDGDGCTNDTCNPTAGCVYTPIQGCQCDEDSDCSDENVCTGTETCNLQNNQCMPGTPVSCSDGNVCTTDGCDPVAGCQHVNNTSACNDGSACTADDICSGGVLSGSNPLPVMTVTGVPVIPATRRRDAYTRPSRAVSATRTVIVLIITFVTGRKSV